MCPRYSSGEVGVFRFSEDVRRHVRAQRLGSHHLDPALEQIVKEEAQLHEVIEGLAARLEFDEQVHVALPSLLPADERAKEPDPLHAEPSNSGSVRAERVQNVLFGSWGSFHLTLFPDSPKRRAEKVNTDR